MWSASTGSLQGAKPETHFQTWSISEAANLQIITVVKVIFAAMENGKKVLRMDEYIEREAAYEDFEKCNSENPKWTPSRVETLIARQKAADVAPVRHGRWEKKSGLYSCSECGMTCPYDVQADVIEYWACNYCPNCGTKMDLEAPV